MCVDDHEPILVNNLAVIAWGYDEWKKNIRSQCTGWYNNR